MSVRGEKLALYVTSINSDSVRFLAAAAAETSRSERACLWAECQTDSDIDHYWRQVSDHVIVEERPFDAGTELAARWG